MADERLQKLEEDNEAMRELLETNGLLLRLKEPTLGRALAVRGKKRTIRRHISAQIELHHPWVEESVFEHVLQDISTLADIPRARRGALKLLVRFGLRVWFRTLVYNDGLDEVCHLDSSETDTIEDMLVEMLNAEMAATAATSGDHTWEFQLLKQIQAGRDDLDWRYLRVWSHGDGFFPRSLKLLYERHSRRVADLLATKVAGHHLPPELVEMVRDGILEDGDVLEESDDDESDI